METQTAFDILLERLKENPSYHFNSSGYRAIKKTLEKLAEKSRPFYQTLPNGDLPRVSEKELAEIRVLSMQVKTACEDYLNGKSKPEKERYADVRLLHELMEKDTEALGNAKAEEYVRLPELITKGRTQTVEIDPSGLNSVGANMNSRLVIPAGKTHGKGYFTRESRVPSIKEASDAILAKYKERYPQYEGYFEQMREANERYLSMDIELQSEEEEMREFFEKHGRIPSDSDAGFFVKNAEDALRGTRWNLYNLMWNDDAARKIIFEMSLEYRKAYFQLTVQRYAGIRAGDRVDQRNAAMSRVAQLLGCEGLLAHSQRMRLKVPGQEEPVEGIFMEEASGIELGSISSLSPEWLETEVDFNTPELKEQVSRLQVLDYICGNVDRHFGNMLYRLERGEDGKARVTGLMGIDNDLSFGVKEYQEGYEFFTIPSRMLFMPKQMADTVLSLDRTTLRETLKDLLPETQIDAAWERTKKLQEQLMNDMARDWTRPVEFGHIHVIEDEDFKDAMRHPDYDLRHLGSIVRYDSPQKREVIGVTGFRHDMYVNENAVNYRFYGFQVYRERLREKYAEVSKARAAAAAAATTTTTTEAAETATTTTTTEAAETTTTTTTTEAAETTTTTTTMEATTTTTTTEAAETTTTTTTTAREVEEEKEAEAVTGEPKAAEAQTGEPKAAEAQTGEPKAAEAQSEAPKEAGKARTTRTKPVPTHLDALLGQLSKNPSHHFYSSGYRELKHSLKELADASRPFYQPLENGDLPKVTEQDALKIRKLSVQVGQACKEYLAGRKHPEGARYSDVRLIQELMEKDANALGNVKVEGDVRLPELITNGRTRVVEKDPATLSRVGANMSSRMRLSAENGHPAGFFTPASKVAKNAEKTAEIMSKYSALYPQYAVYIDCALKYGIYSTITEVTHGNPDEEVARKNFQDVGISGVSAASELIEKFRTNAAKFPEWDVAAMLGTKPEASRDDGTSDYSDFREMLFQMSMDAAKAGIQQNTLLASAGMKPGDSIEERNVAMSRMAQLLGCSGILAHSQRMELKVPGQEETIKGVFMEEAKGLDYSKAATDASWYSSEKVFDSPDAIRQIADMQILDYVCGNVDRHLGNMFYRFEKGEDGKEVLAGITGIDNDCSFGMITGRETRTDNDVALEDMLVIPQQTAAMVSRLAKNKEEMKIALQDLIPEDEVEMAWNRLQNINELVQMDKDRTWGKTEAEIGHIRIVKEEEWKEISLENLSNNRTSLFQRIHGMGKELKQDYELRQAKEAAAQAQPEAKEQEAPQNAQPEAKEQEAPQNAQPEAKEQEAPQNAQPEAKEQEAPQNAQPEAKNAEKKKEKVQLNVSLLDEEEKEEREARRAKTEPVKKASAALAEDLDLNRTNYEAIKREEAETKGFRKRVKDALSHIKGTRSKETDKEKQNTRQK